MEGEFVGMVIGASLTLTFVLVILKVTETITTSWLWVLSPLWGLCGMILGLVVLLIVLIVSIGGMSSQDPYAQQRAALRLLKEVEDEPED